MNNVHSDGPASGAVPPLPAAVDVGAYVVDDAGRIVQVNARAEELLGRPAENLIGRDAHDLLHRNAHGGRLPSTSCPMMRAFLARRPAQEDEAWFERGDGTLLRVAWLVAPHRTDDGGTGAVVIFHEAVDEPSDVPTVTVPLSELDRLALLAETTTTLTATLNAEEAVQRLTRLLVPRLADWVVVDLITEENDVRRAVVVQHQADGLVRRHDLEGPMPPIPQESPMPLSRALRGVAASLAGPGYYQGTPDSGIAVTQRELFAVTGMHSAAIAPIRGVREVLGAVTLGRATQPEAFDPADLSLLEDITRRAGLALSNARLYQRQRRVAETMQRHLLPHLPRVAGLGMAARYLPAPHASQVGGDWYDAFVLPDKATALVIGDVAGHDLDAAAGMAQVRNMLRAYAWAHQEPPSAIVDRLDQAVLHITDASMATMVFARVEPVAEATWQLRWTNAGHPPPLLVTHDGQTRYLDDAHGILLGSGVRHPRTDAVTALPPLSTLVLYTDGLIEAPRRSLDIGLSELRRHAAALAQRPLEAFCDLLLSRVRPADNTDDIALLALRTPSVGEG